MDDLVKRLRALPRGEATVQGGLVTLPGLIHQKGREPIEPVVPLWADAESGIIHTNGPMAPDDDPIAALLDVLVDFAESFLEVCPSRLEFQDPVLADELGQYLRRLAIKIEVVERMPAFDEAVQAIVGVHRSRMRQPKGLLDARGMKMERIHAFAEAAKEFFVAAPWRFLSDTDFIQVESPNPPKGFACFTVLGAGRTVFGLGLYQSRNAYERFLAAGESGDADILLTADLTQVSFDPLDALSAADAKLWSEHDLPVAGPQAYPSVTKYRRRSSDGRPTTRELTFLEGLLRAIAGSTEAEVDTGRWEKSVATFDGIMTYQLVAPDLLANAHEDGLFSNSVPVTRRASERMLGAIQRYFDENPPSNEDEMNQTMQRLFVGRSLDDMPVAPRTPAEKAQELCYRAADAHGRQRVKLAREALALDPNCADAYVILGEQSGTLEDQLRFYESAVNAGETRLGHRVFEEDAGHFWGVLETRPYMRARLGLAHSLIEAGRSEEAIGHLQEMLRLNPNDNQGVRYILIGQLLSQHRDADAARLIKEYEEDGSANWQYAKVILAFRLSGPSMSAQRELDRAIANNPDVLELVVSKEPPPPLPTAYSPGSPEEAAVVLDELSEAFESSDGLMEWLEEANTRWHKQQARQQRAQRQRQREQKKKHKRR